MANALATDAIMSPAQMKPLLHLAKDTPVPAAIGLTGEGQGVILLHKLTKPKQLLSTLKSPAGKAKVELQNNSLRFGRAEVDAVNDPTTVKFTVNKDAPNAMAVRLRALVKDISFTKVVFVVDPTLEQEPEEEAPGETPTPPRTTEVDPRLAQLKLTVDAAEKQLAELALLVGSIPDARPLLAGAIRDLKNARQSIEANNPVVAGNLIRAGIESLRQAREIGARQRQPTQPTPPPLNTESPPVPTATPTPTEVSPLPSTPPPPPQRTHKRSEQLEHVVGSQLMTPEMLRRTLDTGIDFSGRHANINLWKDPGKFVETQKLLGHIQQRLDVPLEQVDPEQLGALADDIGEQFDEVISDLEVLRGLLQKRKEQRQGDLDEAARDLLQERREVGLLDEQKYWLESNPEAPEDDSEDDEEEEAEDDGHPDTTYVDDDDNIRVSTKGLREIKENLSKLTTEEREKRLQEIEEEWERRHAMVTETMNQLTEKVTRAKKKGERVDGALNLLREQRESWSKEKLAELLNSIRRDPAYKSVKDKLKLGEAMHSKMCGITLDDLSLDGFSDDDLDREKSVSVWKGGGLNTVSKLVYKDNTERVFKREGENTRVGRGIPSDAPHMGARNLASSDLADALDTDVIVKSRLVVHDGSIGVLMDMAKGVPAKWSAEQVKEHFSKEKLAKLQDKLSELEWCDLLSGQWDRNNENYLIDMSGEDVSVKGIDNDLCFGSTQITQPPCQSKDAGFYKGIPKPALISKKIYTKIMDLDFDRDLLKNLEGRLTEDEVEASRVRLEQTKRQAQDLWDSKCVVDDWNTWTIEVDGKRLNASQYLMKQSDFASMLKRDLAYTLRGIKEFDTIMKSDNAPTEQPKEGTQR